MLNFIQASSDVGFPLLEDDFDEAIAVQKVLDELLQKPLEGKAFQDLGLQAHKKTNDPKTRMEIRQQQVADDTLSAIRVQSTTSVYIKVS